eukprot:2110641-Pyramimonas_sp.AAC.1
MRKGPNSKGSYLVKVASPMPTRLSLESRVSRPPEASPKITRGSRAVPVPRQPAPRPLFPRRPPEITSTDGGG